MSDPPSSGIVPVLLPPPGLPLPSGYLLSLVLTGRNLSRLLC